ncbi:hypothetical protein MKEN_00095400 [Mycena kentingensis (nom. inval.)]|nr:hypothetical protein MKEN_00095400 [Mycena kentingensis (nom. inval.)]
MSKQRRTTINAVAFISPQNHPILIRCYGPQREQTKYHYLAHTSLDVIEERATAGSDCYLGLLYTIEDVAVYGYQTPLKMKMVLAIALSDAVVRDVEVTHIFKSLHMSYYSAISNPFLKLDASPDATNEHAIVGNPKWKNFRRRIDEICSVVGNPNAA